MTSGTPASHTHGGNIQVLTDPNGLPVWTSPVEPGSPHDLTAAREHALAALYPDSASGLPNLTDKGYIGVGIGINVRTKDANLTLDDRGRNLLINVLRAPAKRANAQSTFRALRRVTLCPWRIGQVAAAALVILTMQRGRW